MISDQEQPRILVTGAASGIGARLCDRLRSAGTDVIPLDIRPVDGGLSCDLSEPFSIDAVAGRIEGRLHGIAHVAGIPGTAPPDRIAAVNLVALRRLTSALCGRLQSGASIVVVSSVTAHRCEWTPAELEDVLSGDDEAVIERLATLSGPDAYAASKKLANHWSCALSARLLPQGVRVNVVSPGPVETPILKDFEESMGAARIQAAAEIAGRHGDPDEVAALITFLLSDDAAWINGANIACDGGFSNARNRATMQAGAARAEEHSSCN